MLKRFAFMSLMLFISAALSTTMAQRRKTVVDLIVRGGTVVTMDGSRRVIENGGVAIKGSDRNDVLVRAKIQTAAPTKAEAEQLAKEVRVETAGLRIHAEGPDSRDNYGWSVSFEIFVPRRSDLSIQAHNGGISIADVTVTEGNSGTSIATFTVKLSQVAAGAVTYNIATSNGSALQSGSPRNTAASNCARSCATITRLRHPRR